MKKFLCVLLAVMLFVTCFAGCKRLGKDVFNSKDIFAVESTTTETSEPQSQQEEFTKPENYASVVTVSINPQFRLYLDINGIVLAVESANDDAKSIETMVSFASQKVDVVVNNLIVVANDNGFVKSDAKIDIKITEVVDESVDADSVLDEIKISAEKKVTELKIKVEITTTVELETKEPIQSENTNTSSKTNTPSKNNTSSSKNSTTNGSSEIRYTYPVDPPPQQSATPQSSNPPKKEEIKPNESTASKKPSASNDNSDKNTSIGPSDQTDEAPKPPVQENPGDVSKPEDPTPGTSVPEVDELPEGTGGANANAPSDSNTNNKPSEDENPDQGEVVNP